MKPISNHSEMAIDVELIDLDDVSLTEVRDLDDAVVKSALRYAEEQANRPSKTETSCSSLASF